MHNKGKWTIVWLILSPFVIISWITWIILLPVRFLKDRWSRIHKLW